MPPRLLFREDALSRDELVVARKFFPDVTRFRTDCRDNLVVGRYSVLPFYDDLQCELVRNGSQLINSPPQHEWIAGFHYYHDLVAAEIDTPRSWTQDEFVRDVAATGPFVVKGATNSRKHQWRTKMYAETRADAIRVAWELRNDGLIETQPIIYREYVPLVQLEESVTGLPFAHEWRLFFLGKHLLCYGFYWSEAECADRVAALPMAAYHLAHRAAHTAAKHVNFFVVDIAEKATGGWTVIELNDGQMSGLSMCSPYDLYKGLATHLPTFQPV